MLFLLFHPSALESTQHLLIAVCMPDYPWKELQYLWKDLMIVIFPVFLLALPHFARLNLEGIKEGWKIDKNERRKDPRLSSSLKKSIKACALRWKERKFIESHWGSADERKNLCFDSFIGVWEKYRRNSLVFFQYFDFLGKITILSAKLKLLEKKIIKTVTRIRTHDLWFSLI